MNYVEIGIILISFLWAIYFEGFLAIHMISYKVHNYAFMDTSAFILRKIVAYSLCLHSSLVPAPL